MTEETTLTSPVQTIENTTSDQKTNSGTPLDTTSDIKSQTPSVPRIPLNPPDIDWSKLDKIKFGVYTPEEREKLVKSYESTITQLTEHEIIPGRIVSITDKYVVLNIGFKSDGLVSLTEFKDAPEQLSIGNTVDVYLESLEDKNGQLVLSRKKAKIVRIWDKINGALQNEETIDGVVKRRTKGGLVVDLFGVEAFLPGSQIDIKPVRDFDIYVGKKMQFRVVKINHPHENVVVSHKILIEKDIEEQKSNILKNLEKGQVLEGIVKNITDFGVFIDLGGLDGLLHLTDLTWGRINHPSDLLKLDQKINVVVLDFDDNKKRISLGMKQLEPHPWDNLPADLTVGSKVVGKVVTVTEYGVFMEIRPGIEGLIHISELSWSSHPKNPQEYIKPNDNLDAVILTMEKEERKMSLSIKQLTEDPWKNINEKYPVGTKFKGVVKNMTNFGLFVELEEGIDGLVHISDLSWTKKINHPSEFIQKEQSLDVIVTEIDTANRRLALGHKQLEEDPWETFTTIFTTGSIHKCTIIKMTEKGAVCELPYGLQGFAPIKQLKKTDGTQAQSGETLPFKVVDFSKESKKITLSHTRIQQDLDKDSKNDTDSKKEMEEKEIAEDVKKVKSKVEKTTLADTHENLKKLKDKITNEDNKELKDEATVSDEPKTAKASKSKKSKTEDGSEDEGEKTKKTKKSKTDD